MATGDDIFSFSAQHLISESTILKIIKQTTRALHKTLAPDFLKPPTTPEDWKGISEVFLTKWNMPNCIGALDGKHVRIKAPAKSGSIYYNYKGFFSIVLLALCDGSYKFLLVDVGAYGSESDSGIFVRSEMGKAVYGRTLNIPRENKLPGTDQKESMFIVGDKAFEMSEFLMKPYPKKMLDNDKKKIFNYRISRARRTIENSFGILAARWRILQKTISLNIDNASMVVLATIVLHNFLLTVSKSNYCPDGFDDRELPDGTFIHGNWRNDVSTTETNEAFINLDDNSVDETPECTGVRSAYAMRDRLANYFISDVGKVPWQDEYIQRGFFGDVEIDFD